MLLICTLILSYISIRIASRFSKYLSKYDKKDHLRFAFGIATALVGFMHIILPSFFGHLFSTIFSSTYEIINVAGFIQLVCGIGLLIRRVYREAAIILCILLALFIPLSILMLTKYIPGPLGAEYEPVLGYLRIIAFPVLIWILIKTSDLSPRKGLINKKFDQDI
ncbi:hypothetical protein [Ancylomarina longa]|uniref:DoxX family protein n=1 Tax=Ancylomarina longa TaxID=2487017 RepID=A0A434AFA1_9BACT|nr:hypothetical protein [Ancylomarina longa]RUT73022.1 hypothetical protein DLK05_15475 [Ancylomarina longa]